MLKCQVYLVILFCRIFKNPARQHCVIFIKKRSGNCHRPNTRRQLRVLAAKVDFWVRRSNHLSMPVRFIRAEDDAICSICMLTPGCMRPLEKPPKLELSSKYPQKRWNLARSKWQKRFALPRPVNHLSPLPFGLFLYRHEIH